MTILAEGDWEHVPVPVRTGLFVITAVVIIVLIVSLIFRDL